MSSDDLVCPPDPTSAELGLGIFLLIGTVVSFLPQHIKLYQKKTHVGLSISKVVLATMTASTGLTYYALVENYGAFFCCFDDSLVCFANVNNFLQLVVIVLCDQVILFMFIYYFDHSWLHEAGLDAIAHWVEARRLSALVLGYQCLLALLFGVVVGTTGWNSREGRILGMTLLLVSSLGQFLQWAPQIWRTYKLKHIGALSVPMVFLQAVGAALTAYFFYLDSNDESYTWVPFVIACVLITTLCVLATVYWRRDRKEEKRKESEEKRGLINDASA